MATPCSPQSSLGKRKMGDDDPDDERDTLFIPEASRDSTYGSVTADEQDAKLKTNEVQSDDDVTSEPEQDGYSEQKEPLPHCAAYDPAFEQISERISKLAMQAHVKLDAHNSDSPNVQLLRTRAAAVATVPKPEPIMVGLLGEAGAGLYIPVPCRKARLTLDREELFAQFYHRCPGSRESSESHIRAYQWTS